MSTSLHSFMDIFDTVFGEDANAVQLKKITIPIIQRDYAQGRIDPDVNRVRDRFLDSLYRAVVEKPITLDFVYGDIDENGVMTPLDGQQRLTTLFLLHWYAAKKEGIPEDNYEFLRRFSYETRYSARYFCTELVNFKPSFSSVLSKEIVNQAWFPLDWKKDPTISSMLKMLDDIDKKFHTVDGLWNSLANSAITFYFLPIKDMGLTDELYIKMNSRGKPLTLFEHFKAELEREMRSIDEETANRVVAKIDREWTDLLWGYRNSGSGTTDDNITDDVFLRYFKFICDVICYRGGESPQGKSSDEFDLLQRYFSSKNENALKNIETLEKFFDCWCDIPGYTTPLAFLESFMAPKHETQKILVEPRYKLDIFEDCLHAYSDKTGRTRQFPLNRIVLLYAITSYLQKCDQVTADEFARRIRIVNNLIQNSEDEVSDRTDRNRIPAILEQVDVIILTGKIDDSIENNFNVNQLQEEKEKIEFVENNPDKAEKLFELEDNSMLRGQIGIVGIEHLEYADRFINLFSGTCRWDLIDCAMMSIGNYGQMERNAWRYQFASKGMQYAWDELFHKSANSGFNNTKAILIKLLEKSETFSNAILQQIIDEFIQECESKNEYLWQYYYVKYSEYRPGSYGKLSNSNVKEKPYMFSVLQTKSQWSSNSYIPYLKVADDSHLSRDDMGQRLVYGDTHIVCQNESYLLRNNEDESVIETIEIAQNEQGVDIEDRIVKLKEYIAMHFGK